jgi:hypothetical protein
MAIVVAFLVSFVIFGWKGFAAAAMFTVLFVLINAVYQGERDHEYFSRLNKDMF